MIALALKMLVGNKASFIGVIFGIFLATLLISQQSAIFLGLVSRSYRTITDIPSPNIWVMDPATDSIDRVRSMPGDYLDVVRSTIGVEWAVPLNIMNMPLVTQSGIYEICELYGIDDATLIGAPINMIEGDVRDMRRDGGVVVDIYSAKGSLSTRLPDGSTVPLKIGDELEINNTRAVVVGLCKITQGFYPQPIVFTTNSNFQNFNPGSRNRISFIVAKSLPDENVDKVVERIDSRRELDALNRNQFKWRIIQFFLRTVILINFGLYVGLGIIIGFSIAGQIFYIMTLENLMYYALIKALGGTKKMMLQMIAAQAILVGVIGFILGTAVTMLWGIATEDTTLAFLFPWQLLLFTGAIACIICLFTAGLSISKVFRVDPKALMGN